MARVFAGAVVAVMLAGLAPACRGDKDPPRLARAPRLPPPDRILVADLPRVDHGELMELVRAPGARATVVAVWATWCQPCIEELARLSRYDAAHRDEGLRVIGLCLDDADRMAPPIQAVLDRVRPPYTMVAARPGQQEALVRRELPGWGGSLPLAFLFGPDGQRLAVVEEALDDAALAARITPLLAR